jgi:hypothetical protein
MSMLSTITGVSFLAESVVRFRFAMCAAFLLHCRDW